MTRLDLKDAPLGKKSAYIGNYDPTLLFPILRENNRSKLNISGALPFKGIDIWNAYELSWLNPQGKPHIAIAEFIFPCESPYLVESKSFKLYLNSLNQSQFANVEAVREVLIQDLATAISAPVEVNIILPTRFSQNRSSEFQGICLDELEISCNQYTPHPEYLTTENNIVTEKLYSNLLKSNCLITGQPDWGSVYIEYTGKQINHAGLLKYIISFRNQNDFNEQCIERIFVDILNFCKPSKLTIHGRYTRRGGLDTNPYRTTDELFKPENLRLCRQ